MNNSDSPPSRYFPALEPLSPDDFFGQLPAVLEEMKQTGAWFEDGTHYRFRKAEGRSIALGRKSGYRAFADFLYKKYGRRFYLLDFMTREDYSGPGSGLLHYILRAEEIHVSLEGLSPLQVFRFTIGRRGLIQSGKELRKNPMTLWELNQIFFRGLLSKTTFHLRPSSSRVLFFIALGGRVPLKRILADLPKDAWITLRNDS